MNSHSLPMPLLCLASIRVSFGLFARRSVCPVVVFAQAAACAPTVRLVFRAGAAVWDLQRVEEVLEGPILLWVIEWFREASDVARCRAAAEVSLNLLVEHVAVGRGDVAELLGAESAQVVASHVAEHVDLLFGQLDLVVAQPGQKPGEDVAGLPVLDRDPLPPVALQVQHVARKRVAFKWYGPRGGHEVHCVL
uniref:Putative secreted protein n=1 Tax=Ixodes ricinus TaxID=34613 RepID=A0A6B0V1M7_IXORI